MTSPHYVSLGSRGRCNIPRYVGARLGDAAAVRVTLRLVIDGAIGMAATYGFGALFGTAAA